MSKKWYSVRRGEVPGVYEKWEDCLAQVNGWPDNSYKGFQTRQEAEDDYLQHTGKKSTNHEVGKADASQIRPSRSKDFLILVLVIVIMYLLFMV